MQLNSGCAWISAVLDHPPNARCCTRKSEPNPRCTTEPLGSSHQSPPHGYLGEVGVGQSEVAGAKMFCETESNPAPGNTPAVFGSIPNLMYLIRLSKI